MKKFFFVSLFTVFASVAFPQVIFWDSDFSVNVEPCVAFTFIKDPCSKNIDVSVKGDYSSDVFSVQSGFCYESESFGLTAGIRYAPLFCERFNLGLETRYHFLSHFDLFDEHDILAGIFFDLPRKNVFSMSTCFSYFFKSSLIASLKDSYGVIKDNTLSVDFHFDWVWANAYEIYFDIGNTSFFDYLLFATPLVRTGFVYHINDRYSAGIDFKLKTVDMFTVCENLSQMKIGFFGKMCF
ncbi:MAG: hypothetical protein MJ182_03585 [Treponema sp.]|nr:hypothetical protein [Treponema sp.]